MAQLQSSSWTASVAQGAHGPEAAFHVAKNGGQPEAFDVKGMCYSPCPIGGSNRFGPAIGDWYWDSAWPLTSWEQVWRQDLPRMEAIGVNLIRVYCMLAIQQPPADQSREFTHKVFLDACAEAGIFVLVGIPLDPNMFWLGHSVDLGEAWWTNVLRRTVAQVADHPAVMGFTIANEVDNGAVSTYGPPDQAAYWWSQVEAMAKIAKAAAPTKLVGIANHDDPGIAGRCQQYMAACRSIDFWGVNTYQPQRLDPVFGGTPEYPIGYSTLTGGALKPVLLTEYGFPSTSRPDALVPAGIYSDAVTQGRTAAVIARMVPAAFREPMNTGVCYFTFCDEWWKQTGYTIDPRYPCTEATPPDVPVLGAGGHFEPVDVYSWFGGPVACAFPNYYWDDSGFGLYGVAPGAGRDPKEPWNLGANAPAQPLDQRLARQPMLDALKTAWAG